jgi:hypothetical protein
VGENVSSWQGLRPRGRVRSESAPEIQSGETPGADPVTAMARKMFRGLSLPSAQQSRDLCRVPMTTSPWRRDVPLVECGGNTLEAVIPAERSSAMTGARSAAVRLARAMRALGAVAQVATAKT